MLRKLHGRKLAVCLLGGTVYALFAAVGWQAEHGGHIRAGYALLTAVLLVGIIGIKHILYAAIRHQEQQKSEEPS